MELMIDMVKFKLASKGSWINCKAAVGDLAIWVVLWLTQSNWSLGTYSEEGKFTPLLNEGSWLLLKDLNVYFFGSVFHTPWSGDDFERNIHGLVSVDLEFVANCSAALVWFEQTWQWFNSQLSQATLGSSIGIKPIDLEELILVVLFNSLVRHHFLINDPEQGRRRTLHLNNHFSFVANVLIGVKAEGEDSNLWCINAELSARLLAIAAILLGWGNENVFKLVVNWMEVEFLDLAVWSDAWEFEGLHYSVLLINHKLQWRLVHVETADLNFK